MGQLEGEPNESDQRPRKLICVGFQEMGLMSENKGCKTLSMMMEFKYVMVCS